MNKLYDKKEVNDLRELLIDSVEVYSEKTLFKYKKNFGTKEEKQMNISYADFKKDVVCFSTKLLNLNLENKRVAIIAPNRYEWCVSYFAVITGGGVVVPLDKSLPNNEIESLIMRSEAEVVVFDEKYFDIFSKMQIEKNTNLKYFICMDSISDNNNILSFDNILNDGKKLLDSGDEKYEKVVIDREKMSIMLFTSGTTAISKAVMLSHKNICANITALRNMVNITTEDTSLSFLPLHHTFESTACLFFISCGASISFCDGLKYIVKNLKEYKVTVFVCVPLMLEAMLKKINDGIHKKKKDKIVKTLINISNFLLKFKIDIRKILFKAIINELGGHLRLLISGAAAINKDTLKGFNDFGILILQGYGLTETSPVLAAEDDKHQRIGSVGFPVYNIEVKIDNQDENGIGEIIARGPSIMLGYFENKVATDEVLKNGWFYTGDLGRFDKDGILYIMGRKKTVIVLKNGKNIYPEELEIVVNKLPFVTESMIFGKKTKNDDLDLGCKIVYNEEILQEQCGVKKEDFKNYIWGEIKTINQNFPAYKRIKEIIITDVPLIKTTTQKIKRHEEMKLIK